MHQLVRHLQSEHQAEAIRNECIAAFKPEVQRLLDKHKAEIAMLQKEHAVEQEKMAAKIPAKAARMAKKQVRASMPKKRISNESGVHKIYYAYDSSLDAHVESLAGHASST